MAVTTIKKDITTVESGIIVHQVNCRGVMGSGAAKAIRDKYPQHFYDYYNHLRFLQSNERPALGTVVYTKANDVLTIAGVCGQLLFGVQKKVVYTDYSALERGLAQVQKESSQRQIYLPYGIGCGLANGDWAIVEQIIQRTTPNAILCKID